MRIDLQVPGFEGRELYVEMAPFGDPKLILDGALAPQGAKKGEYALTTNDSTIATAKFKGFFLDPGTQIEIDGNVIQLLPPLEWYEWVWTAIPVVLLLLGGAIGGAIGGMTVWFNVRIFRLDIHPMARYALSGLLSFGAIIGYLFLALLITFALK